MSQVLSRPTSTAPDCGVENTPATATTISRAPVPQGFLVWLPAICILIGMPLLAFATTKYFLLPSLKRAYTQEAAMSQGAQTLFLAKIPLNPSGANVAHHGIRGIALIGAASDFKAKVDQNKAKLTALEARLLNGVTVAELDKPGALDVMRTRLLVACNQTLGGPVVKEVYISEWPMN